MKKLLVIACALLMLAGCTSKGYSQLSNGTDVIFTGPETSYTKNDLYKSLKLASQESVEADIINKICELEEIDMSSLQDEAQEMVDFYVEMGYETYLTYYYGSTEAFIESYIEENTDALIAKKYVEDNFDEFVAEDKPVKMQVAYFSDEETAAKVIEEVNNGSTFDMAIANNGYEYESADQVYLDTSDTLDVYVKQYLNETDTTGISSVITSTSTSSDADGNIVNTNTYYVVNVTSRNIEDYKDDYISLKVEAAEDDEVKNYFFEKHEIAFYDQDIYEMMKAEYEVLQ